MATVARCTDDSKLPGGARIQLRGYLPDKTCRICRKRKQAGMFLREIQSKRNKWRCVLDDDVCAWCAHRDLPRDLLPMQLCGRFLTDDGQRVGWQERTRAGVFGPQLPLDSMQFRRTLDGVVRPQPRFERRKGAPPVSRVDARTIRLTRDPQRTFSRAHLQAAINRQCGLCDDCGLPPTADDPFVAGHYWPHARGGSSTDPSNCTAVHASCNAWQSDMTFEEYQEWKRAHRPLPFRGGTI